MNFYSIQKIFISFARYSRSSNHTKSMMSPFCRRQMSSSSSIIENSAEENEIRKSSKQSAKINNQNSPQRESIRNLLSAYGESIVAEKSDKLFLINGWIRQIQKQKRVTFLHIDDGTHIRRLQAVFDNQLLPEAELKKLSQGCSIAATGHLIASTGPQQAVELRIASLRLIGECDRSKYVLAHLTPPNATAHLDYLRERIHLRARLRYFQSLLRLRSELQNAIQIYMKQEGFTHITVPAITANDCEGGGECFTLEPVNWKRRSKHILVVDDDDDGDNGAATEISGCDKSYYFGRQAYLTVSGQLHLEAAAAALSKVYTIGTVFRAEKSMSPKHLSEFTMLEAEEAWHDDGSLDSLLDRVEAMCKFFTFYLERYARDDLEFVRSQNSATESLIGTQQQQQQRYARIRYRDAVELLRETGEFPALIIRSNDHRKIAINLNAQMERRLVELHQNRPLFVTHFPASIKPFYMKRCEDEDEDEENALCFDLLAPICGEICGGSLREDRLDRLEQNIDQQFAKSVNRGSLEWYLDLRRFGSAPTGGFGLGFDRFVQTITGAANIKDVVPFPRWPYHCHL